MHLHVVPYEFNISRLSTKCPPLYAIFPVSSSLRGLQGGFVFKCNLFTLSHVTRETSTNWGRNIAFAGESLYKHNVYTNRKNLDL